MPLGTWTKFAWRLISCHWVYSLNLISPEEMSKVLFQIKNKIPQMFRLPCSPGRKLWSYFRTLNCATIIEEDKLIIFIVIPLVDANEKY